MALTKRATAATLAGLALAGACTAPADAYWRANGSATRTVRTAAAPPSVIKLNLSKQGNKVTAAGTVGIGGAYGSPVTVTVILCTANSWPCASVAATLTTTVNSGTAFSVQSASMNNVTVYGRASQTQTAGWIDYSAVAGPVST